MSHYRIIQQMGRKELVEAARKYGIKRPHVKLSSTLKQELSAITRYGRLEAPIEEWSDEELRDELKIDAKGKPLPFHQRQWEDWKDRGELVTAVRSKLADDGVRRKHEGKTRKELIKQARYLRRSNPELPRFPWLRETRELQHIVVSYDPKWKMSAAEHAMMRKAWPGIQEKKRKVAP